MRNTLDTQGDRVPGDWSRFEVEAVVADYFRMFDLELRREPYSKSEHRRALAKMLDGRSDGSIEFKHANISAVLLDLDLPYIPGYKPRSNYQQLLADVVVERVLASNELVSAVANEVEQPPQQLLVDDPLAMLVDAPAKPDRAYSREAAARPKVRARVNYLERESRNASLGLAGEQLALRFETARLIRAGEPALARRITHISLDDDSAGFDIRSFEADGRERLIEVKTTAWGKQTPFFVSRNELSVSKQLDERYHLYRVFNYRSRPQMFTVPGALDQSFELDATQFMARIA